MDIGTDIGTDYVSIFNDILKIEAINTVEDQKPLIQIKKILQWDKKDLKKISIEP